MTVCATPLSPSWQAEPEVDKDPKRAPQDLCRSCENIGRLFFTTLMVAMMCLPSGND